MGRGFVIVLDTHAWIWWVSDPPRLSRKAAREIRLARAIGISAISCWEFTMLLAKGRIRIDREPLEWMTDALSIPRVRLLPLTPAVAVAAMKLGDDVQGEPSDRIIIATAVLDAATLVTRDAEILGYPGVRAVW